MSCARGFIGMDLEHPDLATKFYVDVVADNMKLILGAFMDMYFQMNRQSNDQSCAHHNFESIDAFIRHYIALEQEQTGDCAANKYQCIELQKDKLMINDCCKRCALFISINLLKLSRGEVVPPPTDCSHTAAHYEDGIRSGYLALLPLDHLQCSKLMFCQSKMWVQYSRQLMAYTATLQQIFQKVIVGELDLREDFEPINRLYRNLHIFVGHGIRNMSLLRPRHWIALLRRSPGITSSHLDIWLQFVKDQMIHEFHQKFNVGLQCMMGFLVIICHAARQIQSKWYQKMDKSQTFSEDQLKNWSKDLRLKWDMMPRAPDRHLYLSFGWIAYEPFTKRLDKMIRTLGREQYSLKWKEMQCQNAKCSVRRKDNELRKCARCGVVRYCSRRCQKADWCDGAHRLNCNRLLNIRLEHEKTLKDNGEVHVYDDSQSQSVDENTMITFAIQF